MRYANYLYLWCIFTVNFCGVRKPKAHLLQNHIAIHFARLRPYATSRPYFIEKSYIHPLTQFVHKSSQPEDARGDIFVLYFIRIFPRRRVFPVNEKARVWLNCARLLLWENIFGQKIKRYEWGSALVYTKKDNLNFVC